MGCVVLRHAAVIACEIRGADARATTMLSVAFVVLRTLYIFAYVGDKATVRSGLWALGYACVLALFALAVFHA